MGVHREWVCEGSVHGVCGVSVQWESMGRECARVCEGCACECARVSIEGGECTRWEVCKDKGINV